MAIFSAFVTTMLLVPLHVASVQGVNMAARDKSTLITMRESIVNKNVFPVIQCGIKLYDPYQCDASGRLIGLNLGFLKLRGRISAAIGRLTKLQSLDLADNQLTGSIPWSIGDLKSLQSIYLASNQLSGSIPWSIGNLKSLTFLAITANKLSGGILWSIGNLTSLQTLYLYNNHLSGSIPSSIGFMTSLQRVSLFNNNLSGIIPATIGNLKSLQYIYVNNNQLTGRIPTTIPQLTSLEEFYVADNYITGPVTSNYQGIPGCFQVKGNCLFGSNFPYGGCPASDQKSKSTCLSFCNALQAGGPCGGKGICSIGKDGKTSACACSKGYNNKASKYTCK